MEKEDGKRRERTPLLEGVPPEKTPVGDVYSEINYEEYVIVGLARQV